MPRAAQAASAVAATPVTPVIPATPAAKRTPAAQPRLGARAARAAPAKAASATAAAAAGSELPASLISARAEQVFGPLQVDSDGVATMREPRHLRLPDTSRERADLPAGTRLRLSAAHRLRESGQPHDVMLWHGERREGAEGGGFQDEVAVLAVFRAGEAAPTDVAEVKTDRMTSFAPLLKFEWVVWTAVSGWRRGSRAGEARRSEPLTPVGGRYAVVMANAAR